MPDIRHSVPFLLISDSPTDRTKNDQKILSRIFVLFPPAILMNPTVATTLASVIAAGYELGKKTIEKSQELDEKHLGIAETVEGTKKQLDQNIVPIVSQVKV